MHSLQHGMQQLFDSPPPEHQETTATNGLLADHTSSQKGFQEKAEDLTNRAGKKHRWSFQGRMVLGMCGSTPLDQWSASIGSSSMTNQR